MSQKYEREIDEILRRMDSTLPHEQPHRRLYRRIRRRLTGLQLPTLHVTPSALMVAALLLALLSYVLRAFLPSLTAPAGLLALGAFVGAIVLSVAQNRRRRPSGWRGRPIDCAVEEPSVWEGWLRRLREWRRGRRRGPHY